MYRIIWIYMFNSHAWGPQEPRKAHMGPARKGPGEPTRAQGAHKGPAHKGPAHKGPGGPQAPRGALMT